MVKNIPFKLYKPGKGFGWALFYTFVTLILFYYGFIKNDILVLTLCLISGIVGLYFTKKSWVPYKSIKKKKNFIKKK